jgi:hypothetical protein
MSCTWNSAEEGAARRCGPFPRRGLEIAGVVVAFFYFWPLAVAYLVWKAMGFPMTAEMRGFAAETRSYLDNLFARPGSGSGGFFRDRRFDGRNHAFEEYRRSELARLDEERRRLDEEARAFSDFVEELKRAKDREEFDAFMRRRRGGEATSV